MSISLSPGFFGLGYIAQAVAQITSGLLLENGNFIELEDGSGVLLLEA